MNIFSIVKKFGDKVISVVEWPVKHTQMLVDFFKDTKKDYPATKAALTGLVARFEAMGPEARAALMSHGFDVPDDIKLVIDLKGLVTYVEDTVLPTIETDYADFLKDSKTPPSPDPAPVGPEPAADPAPAESAVAAAVPSPGLHNVVPA